MRSRKFFLWIFPLLLGIFLGENALLFLVGNGAKIYFRYQMGWELDYHSLQWKNRGLLFTDFSCKNREMFSLQAPSLHMAIQKKHLVIDRPIIIFSHPPQFRAGDSPFPWTCSIKQGVIDGIGLQKSTFSLEKTGRGNVGSLHAAWESASIAVEAMEGEEIHLHLDHVDLSSLRHWLGNRLKGIVYGSFYLKNDRAQWILRKGVLEGKEIGYQPFLEDFCGKMDWEGPLIVSHPLSIFEEGRLRFSIEQGKLALEKGMVQNVEGSLSFDGKAGAKWDFSGAFEGQKMLLSGRGCFQSLKEPWMESELQFSDGSLSLEGRKTGDLYTWDVSAQSLNRQFVSFLQEVGAVFSAPFAQWRMEEGSIDGSAQILSGNEGIAKWELWGLHLDNLRLAHDRCLFSCKAACLEEEGLSFTGGNFSLRDGFSFEGWSGKGNLASGFGDVSGKIGDLSIQCAIEGTFPTFLAHLHLQGQAEGALTLGGKWEEGAFYFIVDEGEGTLFSKIGLEKLQMTGEISEQGISVFDLSGICDVGKKIPFYAPYIQSPGGFDFRFEEDLLERVRFVGQIQEKKLVMDPLRSHCLETPIEKFEVKFSESGVDWAEICWSVSDQWISSFFSLPSFFPKGKIESHFIFDRMKGAEVHFSQEGELAIHLLQEGSFWRLASSRIGDLTFEAVLEVSPESVQLTEGKGEKGNNKAAFTGKFLSWENWHLNFTRFQLDLQSISQLGVQGILEGEGLVRGRGNLEADFDLKVSQLHCNNWILQNQESLHLYGSLENGIWIRGLNLSLFEQGNPSPLGDCKIGLLQYDWKPSLFHLSECQIHVTQEIFHCIPSHPLLTKFVKTGGESFYFAGDAVCASDLSRFSWYMKEAHAPFHIHNVQLDWEKNGWRARFDLEQQERWIAMDLVAQSGEKFLKGRLTVENEMKVDWTYEEKLVVHTLEGVCAGVDASFHLEGDSLIGSARLNCNVLKQFVPPQIARVFNELKMGDGYELMGRVFVDEEGASFRGILSGKQIELFGFQLKNLLAKIELAADHVHISDVKISDFAGVLKIDEIRAQGRGDDPWTISIPHITVTELRPSLLQEVGGPPGTLSPLVVRELHLDGFQGFVDDSNTYTAHGELYFINSYKREKSILEIPSDLLSRIVGLDLDLLIPVCGTLKYQLEDGLFHFTTLEGSFSENKRSEFFLVYNGESPTMDLDWNLHILIQMKQFVLFKFTEAFIISVDGKLDHPKFRLNRKKRFLGVL